MSDLSRKFPRLQAYGKEWGEALKSLIRSLEIQYENVVTAVNSKQDEDGELNIKYYEQAGEPTVATDGNAVLWKDTDDSRVYLVFKNSDGQKKVELT